MLFRRRRREPVASWEVVDYKIVEPVPVCDEDDQDLDISTVAEEDMTRSFVFDFTKETQATNAVVFARQLLFQEIAKRHYNMLLTEGWEIVLSRKGKDYRAEVRYTGRPAYAEGKPHQQQRSPPFVGMLQSPGCKNAVWAI
ncbi:hypothetical protein BJ322DRAFT_1106447 [Thelephora terrestris]|uniref:Uncharacterized protein n=1 Tax=Thelephora terrestris TaxID=56493 RepID=A0A9P6HL09_9AGAM|nr:hypothetical protein BJ322DRAFT_1106447 [Thelephora terrestris]